MPVGERQCHGSHEYASPASPAGKERWDSRRKHDRHSGLSMDTRLRGGWGDARILFISHCLRYGPPTSFGFCFALLLNLGRRRCPTITVFRPGSWLGQTCFSFMSSQPTHFLHPWRILFHPD